MNIVLPQFFLLLYFNTLFCITSNKEINITCKCNNILENPSHKINPFKEKMKHFVPTKPFSSVYLKCDACLAIAKEVGV